jgi:hypothetical protein
MNHPFNCTEQIKALFSQQERSKAEDSYFSFERAFLLLNAQRSPHIEQASLPSHCFSPEYAALHRQCQPVLSSHQAVTVR